MDGVRRERSRGNWAIKALQQMRRSSNANISSEGVQYFRQRDVIATQDSSPDTQRIREMDLMYNPFRESHEDLPVHWDTDDASINRPKPQMRSISHIPYHPEPKLNKPASRLERRIEPENIVYDSTSEDEEQFYNGDRHELMRPVRVENIGYPEIRPKSPTETGEKIIIPTKYKMQMQKVPEPGWVEKIIEEGIRTDPRNLYTPAHWMAILRTLMQYNIALPGLSEDTAYKEDLPGPLPAKYDSGDHSPAQITETSIIERSESQLPRCKEDKSLLLSRNPIPKSTRKRSRWAPIDEEHQSTHVLNKTSHTTLMQDQQDDTQRVPAKIKKPIRGLLDVPIPRPESIPHQMYYTKNPFMPSAPKRKPHKTGCWNCESLDHPYSECTAPKAKFCYRCGTPGKDIHTCPVCPEQPYPHSRLSEG